MFSIFAWRDLTTSLERTRSVKKTSSTGSVQTARAFRRSVRKAVLAARRDRSRPAAPMVTMR